MQVSTLNAQLGLRSEVVDWYRDARLYPTVICLLTCHHEQTIDYVTAQTVDPFLQNFISLNAFKVFGRRTDKICLLSKCSHYFPTSAKVNSFIAVQKSLSLSVRMHKKSVQ